MLPTFLKKCLRYAGVVLSISLFAAFIPTKGLCADWMRFQTAAENQEGDRSVDQLDTAPNEKGVLLEKDRGVPSQEKSKDEVTVKFNAGYDNYTKTWFQVPGGLASEPIVKQGIMIRVNPREQKYNPDFKEATVIIRGLGAVNDYIELKIDVKKSQDGDGKWTAKVISPKVGSKVSIPVGVDRLNGGFVMDLRQSDNKSKSGLQQFGYVSFSQFVVDTSGNQIKDPYRDSTYGMPHAASFSFPKIPGYNPKF